MKHWTAAIGITSALLLMTGIVSGTVNIRDTGGLSLNGYPLSGVGSINGCGSNEFLAGDGTCKTGGSDGYLPDDPPSSDVLMGDHDINGLDAVCFTDPDGTTGNPACVDVTKVSGEDRLRLTAEGGIQIGEPRASYSDSIFLNGNANVDGNLKINQFIFGSGAISLQPTSPYEVDIGSLQTTTLDMNGGNINNVGSCSGCDLAESIDSEEEYEKGTIISISDTEDNTVEISDEEYDSDVVGVVSTNPVINMGSGDGGVNMGVTGKELNTSDGEVPVALAGVVPVKVSDENGDIDRGDAIVPSSEEGIGMKADTDDYDCSDLSVIGKAMEPLDDNQGKINVLVN